MPVDVTCETVLLGLVHGDVGQQETIHTVAPVDIVKIVKVVLDIVSVVVAFHQLLDAIKVT